MTGQSRKLNFEPVLKCVNTTAQFHYKPEIVLSSCNVHCIDFSRLLLIHRYLQVFIFNTNKMIVRQGTCKSTWYLFFVERFQIPILIMRSVTIFLFKRVGPSPAVHSMNPVLTRTAELHLIVPGMFVALDHQSDAGANDSAMFTSSVHRNMPFHGPRWQQYWVAGYRSLKKPRT